MIRERSLLAAPKEYAKPLRQKDRIRTKLCKVRYVRPRCNLCYTGNLSGQKTEAQTFCGMFVPFFIRS